MNAATRFVSLLLVAGTASCGNRPGDTSAGATAEATWEVTAVRYATVPGYHVRNLVEGADSARTVDLTMMVWVLRRPDGTAVLVDTGFHRQKFIDQWKPEDFMPASDAVARMGVTPDQVTDVIVTHVHWDHLDGLDLFPGARVWIQKAEYEHYVGDDGSALERGIDPDDAKMLADARAAGRVELVNGDSVEILPGITVYTGGRHTWASQYLGVNTAKGTVVVASDNCYLYENLERHAPIAQTLDAASNLAALDRMAKLAADTSLIVPGHDPAVFQRFPEPGDGIARIAGM